MKHNKIIYILLGLFISFTSILCLGYSSWIISSSEKINSVKIEQLTDPNLKDISLNIDYNGSAHLPHESISNFDSSNYKITYKDSNGGTIFDTNYLGYTDAGTYKVKYENITSHIVTEIDFKINKILPTISAEQTFYSPNANDYVLKALDISGNPINGTWTKTINGDPSDLTNTAGEGIDSHTISIAYTFTPNADCKNYLGTSDVVEVGLKSVCYIGSKYYSRIENAASLSKNNTSNTSIYVIPLYSTNSTKVYVYDSFEIGSKVSLILPYESTKYNGYEHLTYTDANGNEQYLAKPFARDNTDENLKTSEIVLKSDVTITNKGKLIIGGVLTGGNGGYLYAGHTYGKYAQITMSENTSIDNWGSIESYGYILEDNQNDNSSIIINNSGSSFGLPFIVAEHRGGTNFMNLANMAIIGGSSTPQFKSSAFNRFLTNNVDVIMKTLHNANVIGYANLYAADQDNTTTVSLIGTGGIIELSNNDGYVITNYDHTTEIMDIDVYGGGKLNSLSIEIKIGISFISKTFELSTQSVFLPISYYYNVSLKKLDKQANDACTYDLSKQDIKLLPGAKIHIDEGVVVNAKSIAIYDKFNDVSVAVPVYPTIYKSGETIPSGELNINGTLNVQNIGGNVKTTVSNASLNISSSISVVSNEITGTEYATGYTATTYYLKGNLYQSGNISNNVEGMNVGNYKSLEQNGNYGWTKDTATITFKSEGSIVSTVNVPLFTNGVFTGYSYSNISFPSLDGTKPYYSYTWSKPADTIFENTTINAIWTPIEYAISYSNQYSGFTDTTPSGSFSKPDLTLPENSKYIKFTIESQVISLPTAENVEHENGYTFNGWYFKNDGAKVTSLDPSILKNYLNNGVVEIYAEWYPQGSEKYSIYYHYLDENGTVKDILNPGSLEMVVTNNEWPASASCTYFNNYNTDNTNPINFDGWKTSINGDSIIDALDKSLFDENNELHLYASLREKNYSLKVTYNGLVANKTDINVYYDSATSYQLPEFTAFTPEIISNTYVQKYDTYWYESVTGAKLSSKASITVNNKNMIATLTKETLANEQYYKVSITKGNRVTSFTLTTTNTDILTTKDATASKTATINSNTDIYVKKNVTLTISVNYQGSSKNHQLLIDGALNSNYSSGSVAIATKTHTISASAEYDSCITSDTLITLADGTQVRVDQLKGNELLLVWDHLTGKYTTAKIAYIVSHDETDILHKVVKLKFSDGSTIKIIGEHVFYDTTINKYVAIDEYNINDYITHKFLKYSEGGLPKEIELVGFEIYEEMTRSFEVVTDKHLINFTNGILSTSAYLDPLLNVFELNEYYQYNQEQMIKDIETYGLYTYEDFEGLIDEKAFEMYNAQYLKIAVGKGYITWEEILELIDIYYNNDVKPL